MTEYSDYSPDAIERYLAKLDGIAKWVDKTEQHEPANHFVLLPGEHAHPFRSTGKVVDLEPIRLG
jgi:hypothetical protein